MACVAKYPHPDTRTTPVAGKEDIQKIFGKERYFQLQKSSLNFPNGECISPLSQAMVDEIKEHALAMIVTGVDLSTDIWAIQWPNDYKVRSFGIPVKIALKDLTDD